MKRTRVEMLCDLHPDEQGAKTHTIALDGVVMEVDLCDRAERQLDEAIAPYLAGARRLRSNGTHVGTRAIRTVQRRPVDSGNGAVRTVVPMTINAKAARDWWKRNGRGLPQWKANGALPRAVIDAYREALADV